MAVKRPSSILLSPGMPEDLLLSAASIPEELKKIKIINLAKFETIIPP
ncbi:MAG: hypothetical protein WA137_06940 [Methanothrix sp.]|nr:hypothetical protein [Methanothrix sp.]